MVSSSDPAGPVADRVNRPTVVLGWATGTTGLALASALAADLLGTHPGPLHHHCPHCGSIEHGRPSFDAPVAVSIAYAGAVVLAAAGTVTALGVDLEAEGAAGRAWVEGEAIAKARGTGLDGAPPDRVGLDVYAVEIPGHLAAVAIASPEPAAIRLVPGDPATLDPRARR